MAGVELMLSLIYNASFYNAAYDNTFTGWSPTKPVEYKDLANEINGKRLKITTYNNYPLSWVETDANGTTHGNGLAFIIIEMLQKKFNFTYELVLPNRNYELGGESPEDSIIGLANTSQVDMIAAFVPRLLRYQKMVSFSNFLDEGMWMMMLKRPRRSAAGPGLLAPFHKLVWFLILACVLSYGPCITILTTLRSKLISDEDRSISLSPSFWFVYSSLFKQGTNLAPRANAIRVLFATWWIFIILLSTFYTANLTAFLTLSKFTVNIETPRDLYKYNYRWVAAVGGAVQHSVESPTHELHYLNEMVTNGRAEFRDFPHDSDYLSLVDEGMVLVKEDKSIDRLVFKDYMQKTKEGIDENDRCAYIVAPNAFIRKRRAFAYPIGSHLKELFDPILLVIFESGLISLLKNHDFPFTNICPLDLQSKDRQLKNKDLVMTYFIMGIGVSAALAVFIAELLINRCFPT